MAESEPSQEITYQVAYDVKVSSRIERGVLRCRLKYWAKYLLDVSGWLGFFCLAAALADRSLAPHVSATNRLILILLLGLPFGIIWSAMVVSSQVNLLRKANLGEVWTCTITDEVWSFRRQNGLTLSIPWKIMRLGCVHPDGWLIFYGRSDAENVVVYRQALREAGLEEEFLRRIADRGAG